MVSKKGSELFGKTIGLLGFGNIGKTLISLLQPFNCNILFFDEKEFFETEIKEIAESSNIKPELIHQAELESVLSRSDVISIHLPLRDETKNILSLRELNKLQSNCCIINTARG